MQPCGQSFDFGDSGRIEHVSVLSVQDERVVIGFESAHQRIDGFMVGAEDLFDLVTDGEGVRACGFGVVIKPGAAAVRIALLIVIDRHDQRAPAFAHDRHDVIRQHFSQVRPAHIKAPAEVAKGLNDAHGRFRRHGNVDAAINAFQHADRGGTLGKVALAGQPCSGWRRILCVVLRG